jgi:hypothetical protein
LDGITIDSSDEYGNARDSIRDNRERDSNVIDESDLQDEKHDDPRISTLDGITVASSHEYDNALDSIRDSREFDLNAINCRNML